MTIPKTCLFCIHFNFYAGSPGCSEMTPGSNMDMYCDLKVWDWDEYQDIRELFASGLTCKAFEVDPWAAKRYGLDKDSGT